MKKYFLYGVNIALSLLFLQLQVSGQFHRGPMNYGGLLAGMEWNTISGVNGIEYERILVSRRQMTAGVKASYAFPYETGNMKLLGSACCDMSSIGTVLITADFFTSDRSFPSGFFFHTALGAGGKKYDWDTQRDLIEVRPAFEAGGGWVFPVGRQFALKWTNTLTFASRDGGITVTRIAFGF